MRKAMITAILFSFTFVFILFMANVVDAFDPEAVLQVSRGIAEWKLMNEDKSETQVEPTVYVSSSLSGIVEKGSEGIGVVNGLAAFDNDYGIESQIGQWELNSRVNMSDRYISRLPTNPWVDLGGGITTKAEGIVYQLYNPPPMASATYNVASTAMGAAITGIETIDRLGTSMQIMSPPIYLQNNPTFTASQKILGIPVSGKWEGSGSYPIQGGRVNFQETLITSGPDITRTHTDWAKTNLGSYYRHVEIKTPVTSPMERFMMTHFPVGGYYDLQTSKITNTTKIQQSYRIETYGGMTKVTPLPSSGIGSWGSGGVGSNWNVPKTNWNIPKTNWSIQSTNPFPTYTPLPKKSPLSTYKPSIPKMSPPRIPSSLGRRY